MIYVELVEREDGELCTNLGLLDPDGPRDPNDQFLLELLANVLVPDDMADKMCGKNRVRL